MVPQLSKEEVEFQAKTTKKYSLTEGNDTMNGLLENKVRTLQIKQLGRGIHSDCYQPWL